VAAKPIVIYGDPVLREISKPVDEINQEIKDLVSQMEDTTKEAKGLGLSAVQIGVLKCLFIIDLSAVDITQSLKVFINPEIIEKSAETVEMEEGCLSFPGIYQKITRPTGVTVRATDLDGEEFEFQAEGLAARAVQHEFDHLEGRLFIDLMSPLTRTMLRGRLKKLPDVS